MKWPYGVKAAVAREVGISPQYLNNIIHRRKNAKPELASKLEKAVIAHGLYINKHEWAFATESDHPLFVKANSSKSDT
ncbi:helix-turn-helix transcriptional regulator [Candidatus Pacearchaeota archaeon]|nr:helix-turn-helix transcriptional regulator [Candidatus Pacearchaeota archaeon]